MVTKMEIYLAGKVRKGKAIAEEKDWRLEYEQVLSQIPGIEILSPENPSLDASQPFLVFGHDCHLIKQCDAVVVNATEKLGVGTSQEMLIAKIYRKPLLTVLPKDTHHRRSNLQMPGGIVPDWIHPFVSSASDIVAEDIAEVHTWLASYSLAPKTFSIKGIEIIEDAIQAYLASTGELPERKGF
jgi:hypothetical protein